MEPINKRSDHRRKGQRWHSRADVNLRVVILTLISIACALVLASFFPKPVLMPMLATLLFLSATATVLVALLMAQPIFSRTFTFWDKAAVLYLLSLAANLVADQDTARQFLEARAEAQASMAP